MRRDQRRPVVTVEQQRHDIALIIGWALFTLAMFALAAAADLGRWFA